MTTFNIGDAVTFKPNIDSPEKDCVKGIVADYPNQQRLADRRCGGFETLNFLQALNLI